MVCRCIRRLATAFGTTRTAAFPTRSIRCMHAPGWLGRSSSLSNTLLLLLLAAIAMLHIAY